MLSCLREAVLSVKEAVLAPETLRYNGGGCNQRIQASQELDSPPQPSIPTGLAFMLEASYVVWCPGLGFSTLFGSGRGVSRET